MQEVAQSLSPGALNVVINTPLRQGPQIGGVSNLRMRAGEAIPIKAHHNIMGNNEGPASALSS